MTRRDRAILTLISLLLLPAAAAPQPSDLGVQNPPAHEPIMILSDAAAAGRDSVTHNGVRSGTGTASDPWVISDWTIHAGENEQAIRIQDVRGHLLIRNVVLEVGHESRANGISIFDSDNVRAEGVISRGLGGLLYAERTTVALIDSRAESEGWSCVEVKEARLTVRNLRAHGRCGFKVVAATSSTVLAENLIFQEVAGGFGISGQVQVEIRNAVVTANQSGIELEGGPTSTLSGVFLSDLENSNIELENVTLTGWRDGIKWVNSPYRDAQPEFHATVRTRDVRIKSDSTGVSLRAPYADFPRPAQGTFFGERLTIIGADVALWSGESQAVVSDSLFAENHAALEAYGEVPGGNPDVRVTGSTFVGNDRLASASDGASIVIERSWWDDGDERGNVRLSQKAEGPLHDIAGYRRNEASIGSVAVLAMLAAVVLLGNRR